MGYKAIAFASAHNLTLCKYNDPIEGAREGLTVEEAEAVAREDDSLIYLDLPDFEFLGLDGMGHFAWSVAGQCSNLRIVVAFEQSYDDIDAPPTWEANTVGAQWVGDNERVTLRRVLRATRRAWPDGPMTCGLLAPTTHG
jgi:hypothetical protein